MLAVWLGGRSTCRPCLGRRGRRCAPRRRGARHWGRTARTEGALHQRVAATGDPQELDEASTLGRTQCSSSATVASARGPTSRVATAAAASARARASIATLRGSAGENSSSRATARGEAHVVQHVLPGTGPLRGGQRDRLQRGQRHLAGGRIPERDVVELDPQRGGGPGPVSLAAPGQRHRPGPLRDQRLEVEHLEHAVKAHQRGHHVHLHVGQRGDRAVEPAQQRRQRHQRAELEGTVDHQAAAKAVDHGGGHRGEQASAR